MNMLLSGSYFGIDAIKGGIQKSKTEIYTGGESERQNMQRNTKTEQMNAEKTECNIHFNATANKCNAQSTHNTRFK